MNNKAKICPICGKKFIPKTGNMKYCSLLCSTKGKHLKAKEWQERPGYLEKQRQRIAEYRKKNSERKKELQTQIQEEREAKRIQSEKEQTERQKQRLSDLINAAEQGDLFARMELVERESGNTSPEYWELFKEYDLKYAVEWGYESKTTVNGISVHVEGFGDLVSMAIEESGFIRIER